jgi:hypothetical protein
MKLKEVESRGKNRKSCGIWGRDEVATSPLGIGHWLGGGPMNRVNLALCDEPTCHISRFTRITLISCKTSGLYDLAILSTISRSMY